MSTRLKLWLGLQTDRRGVTALEYGLIAALVAGVIITGVTSFGTQIKATFEALGVDLTKATATNTK